MSHDEEDRPTTDERSSLPPAGGLTGTEVLHAALPLIVRAASESATAATRSAATQASVESRLIEFKTSLDANTSTISRWADAKERENSLRKAELDARNEGNRQWHETLRSVVTPQVILQIAVQMFGLIAVAFGISQTLPYQQPQSATLPVAGDEAGESPP